MATTLDCLMDYLFPVPFLTISIFCEFHLLSSSLQRTYGFSHSPDKCNALQDLPTSLIFLHVNVVFRRQISPSPSSNTHSSRSPTSNPSRKRRSRVCGSNSARPSLSKPPLRYRPSSRRAKA